MAAQEEKQFEKIWLFLHNCEYYDEVNIAIANAPNDWSICSFIISSWLDSKNKFMALQLDKEEATKIRDALSAVIDDMP